MPTLDNIDITPVQRGDQSRGMVIRPSGTTGGHGRGGGLPAGCGGIPASGILAGSRSGTPAGDQGGGAAVGSSTTLAPKGANRHVSFLMTMRYHPTRTSLYRSGCGNFLALGQRCSMRRPCRRLWLTRRPRTRGLWREGCEGEGHGGGHDKGSNCRGGSWQNCG
jgi:hypothetical protein